MRNDGKFYNKLGIPEGTEFPTGSYVADGDLFYNQTTDLAYARVGGEWLNITQSGGDGGSTSWIALTDTPGSYSTYSGRFSKVNDTEDGLVFSDYLTEVDDTLRFTGSTVLADGIIETTPDAGVSVEGVYHRDGLIIISGASNGNIFRIGETAYDLDFTTTTYDDLLSLLSVGVRISAISGAIFDAYPTTLRYPVAGRWIHIAGQGWTHEEGITGAADQGPAILFPLMRPADWQISVTIDDTNVSEASKRFRLVVGYITASNHVGAYMDLYNSWDGDSIVIRGHFYVNDGDDTYTGTYTTTNWAETPTTYKFRCSQGVVGFYDPPSAAWINYEGRQSVGIPFTPSNAFIQAYRTTTEDALDNVWIENIKLEYLR